MCDNETYNNCLEILEDKKKMNLIMLTEKWESFKNKFPTLFEMLSMNSNIDTKMLKYICNKAIEHLNFNNDDSKFKINSEVGEKFAQKYLYNKFQEPTQEQKEMIKNDVKEKLKKDPNFNIFKKG